MNKPRKAKVALLGLMFDLYETWPELKPAFARFAGELSTTLAPFAEVAFPGVCADRAQVEAAVHDAETASADLLIVVLLSYTPSGIALPALRATRLPILIYNTQALAGVDLDTSGDDTTLNHGMHGVQDLANVLLRAGRSFGLLTGHYLEPQTQAELRGWCDAARVANQLRHLRLGLLGYAMEGMGDFGLDETALLAQTGVEVRRLSMRDLAERAEAVPLAALHAEMAADRARFAFAADVGATEHAAAVRLELALRSVLAERAMAGFAAHFIAIGQEGRLQTLPFLAAAKLLADGYGFGGEGDVTSAAAVCAMQVLAGPANFTEMFTMDFAGNAVLMMHMGEGNWRMARQGTPVHALRSTIRAILPVLVDPLLLAFTLEPGPCTLVSLTTVQGGRLKLVATEGEVLDFPYLAALARPHYKFRPAGDLSAFLTSYSLAGGSHHQALAYGRWASTLEKLATIVGIEFANIR